VTEQDDRVKHFAKFVFDLETRFKTWSTTPTDDYAEYMFRKHVREYDVMFRQSSERCNARDCGYPLRSDGTAERLPYIGDVCNLCYFLYHLVASRKHFVEAQRIDDENNSSKRKR